MVLRRAELLGLSRDSIGSLIDDYSSIGKGLAAATTVKIRDRAYDPTVPADLIALQNLATELELRVQHVSDAAERFEAARRYQNLKGGLITHGACFLIGIFGFAWMTLLYPHKLPDTVKVSAPVQVDITVPTEAAARNAGMAKECSGKVLTGVAVGGTLDNPIVVTRAQIGCVAYHLTDTTDLIVVPVATK